MTVVVQRLRRLVVVRETRVRLPPSVLFKRKMKNILFVCKHNRFRSRIAEEYFKKINSNKNINVDSAGIIMSNSPLEKLQVKVSEDFGIKLKVKSKVLSVDLIKKQDLIIIVADDVPKILFNNKDYIDFKKTKIIRWKISDDPGGTNYNKMRKIIKKIIKRVNILVKQLEKVK